MVQDSPRERQKDIRQRLDAIRRAISTAQCDELIVGLELYEIDLQRDLDRILPLMESSECIAGSRRA